MHCTAGGFRANYIMSNSLYEIFPLYFLQECGSEILDAALEYSRHLDTACLITYGRQCMVWMLETYQLSVLSLKNTLLTEMLSKCTQEIRLLIVCSCGKESIAIFLSKTKVKSLIAFLSFHLQMVYLLCPSPSAPWPWLACWQWSLTRWVGTSGWYCFMCSVELYLHSN